MGLAKNHKKLVGVMHTNDATFAKSRTFLNQWSHTVSAGFENSDSSSHSPD
jgi:hypothetical protein